MPHYAVRVTHSYEACKKMVALWALQCERMVVYEHQGEKTKKVHIHMALYNSRVAKKQLRNIAADTGLPVKGNENMSFKEWDAHPDNYCYYMTKGKHDPSYLLHYTKDDADTWKQAWVPPAEYHKVTAWEHLYNDLEPYLPLPPKFDVDSWLQSDQVTPVNHEDFYRKLSSHVTALLYKRHNTFWCPQMKHEKMCIMNTYCYRHKIRVPKKVRVEEE